EPADERAARSEVGQRLEDRVPVGLIPVEEQRDDERTCDGNSDRDRSCQTARRKASVAPCLPQGCRCTGDQQQEGNWSDTVFPFMSAEWPERIIDQRGSGRFRRRVPEHGSESDLHGVKQAAEPGKWVDVARKVTEKRDGSGEPLGGKGNSNDDRAAQNQPWLPSMAPKLSVNEEHYGDCEYPQRDRVHHAAMDHVGDDEPAADHRNR